MSNDETFISVSVTKKQKEAIKAASKKSGVMSIPAWCRSVIFSSMKKTGDYKIEKQ